MRSFFYNLDKTIEYAQVENNKELYKFCYEVKNFIIGGSFTRYKKVSTLMSYWGEPDSFVAKMTGMKESTIRVTRRNLSNELYEQFGYDFFSLVQIGDKNSIKEGTYRFDLAKKEISSGNFLYRELIDQISRGVFIEEAIDIKSCALEIQFLVRHSKKAIEKEIEMLDKNKLAYLIKMLDNEVDTHSNIYNLVKCFER